MYRYVFFHLKITTLSRNLKYLKLHHLATLTVPVPGKNHLGRLYMLEGCLQNIAIIIFISYCCSLSLKHPKYPQGILVIGWWGYLARSEAKRLLGFVP